MPTVSFRFNDHATDPKSTIKKISALKDTFRVVFSSESGFVETDGDIDPTNLINDLKKIPEIDVNEDYIPGDYF